MNHSNESRALVCEVVRGEVGIDRLIEVGVRVATEPRFELVDRSDFCPVAPPLVDFAVGLLSLWVRGGDEAMLWAKVMLGASNTIDLAALEGSHHGALLLDALWCMAAGEVIDTDTVELLREYAR